MQRWRDMEREDLGTGCVDRSLSKIVPASCSLEENPKKIREMTFF
jgi:hypothetical protein